MQNKYKIKNNKKLRFNKSLLILLIIFILVIVSPKSVFAQIPSPHNVDGRVFTDNSQTIGVSGNLPVRINDTVSEDIVLAYTIDPGPPFLKGRYSATIMGNDNDLVIVTAWNATHYGMSNATLLSTTTTIDVVFNRTRASEPNVTIIIPDNNSIKNTTDVFNVTANITILGNDATGCNAVIYFSNNAANITSDQGYTNQLGDIEFHESKTTTWNITGIKEGVLNITVRAQCDSDETNIEHLDSYTININIEDTSEPIINLINPINNTWLNKNITFEYNVTESTGIKNCSLYFDSKLNQTSPNLEPETLLNFTLNNTPEGPHNWYISCFDSSSNFNQGNSSVLNINIDRTSPNVTLLLPLNNTPLQSRNILFKYNVTDNLNLTNCSLILDNELVQTNHTVILNISNNFSRSFGGEEYWAVNCSDAAGNIGYSGYFVMKIPDFKINDSDIVFSIEPTSEKEKLEINATIFNIGNANTTGNVSVLFFENDTYINNVQLFRNVSINVTAGNNVTVSINYTTKIGKFNIIVIVDPPLATNGSILEFNESNNKANKSISIPSYHTFYGDVISDIFLDTSSKTTVFAWVNSTSFEGSIFVADSDSNIDFSGLQALSRNTSNNLAMNDFEELDIALNSTNLTDSINITYTKEGFANNTGNFSVYSSIIFDVPIVNSTNNSNFVTGILWDTSDFDTIGFYNGSQDIAFVTKMNRNFVGLYGTYDYEIKVPANLRRYIMPNAQDTVSFYREIT